MAETRKSPKSAFEIPPKGDPWRDNELERRRRLRRDAQRPLGVNLAEGLANSEFFLSFLGAARRAVVTRESARRG